MYLKEKGREKERGKKGELDREFNRLSEAPVGTISKYILMLGEKFLCYDGGMFNQVITESVKMFFHVYTAIKLDQLLINSEFIT